MPISKKIGSNGCYLCMEERVQIKKAKLFKPHKHTNKNMEIFGHCRHKERIHKYERQKLLTCTCES